jgi:hypothetical protein
MKESLWYDQTRWLIEKNNTLESTKKLKQKDDFVIVFIYMKKDWFKSYKQYMININMFQLKDRQITQWPLLTVVMMS